MTSNNLILGLPSITGSSTATALGSGLFLSNQQVLSSLESTSAIQNNFVSGVNSFSASLAGATNVSSSAGPQDFRVTLRSASNAKDKIIFNVSPNIDESAQVSYTSVDLIHHPGSIQVYKNTSARLFSLNAKLISRTQAEASQTLSWLNLIRSWTKNYFGTGTAASYPSAIGAPPDVLILTGYGSPNLDGIPVVLTNYNWDWPLDCDYISSTEGFPCPTIFEVKLSLEESHSPSEWEGFNLQQYKAGNMTSAFGTKFNSTPSGATDMLSTQGMSSINVAKAGTAGDTSSANLSQQGLLNASIDSGLITNQ